MSELNPKEMLQQYQNSSSTFEMFEDKIKSSSQAITQKINPKKIQQYCENPFDTRKKQIVNMICSSINQKMAALFQRQISKVLAKQKIHENLKIFDYIITRNKILSQIGEDQTPVYDQQQEYLDDLKQYLTKFYNQM